MGLGSRFSICHFPAHTYAAGCRGKFCESGGLAKLVDFIGNKASSQRCLCTGLPCSLQNHTHSLTHSLSHTHTPTAVNSIQDYGDLHERCVGVLALCLEEGGGMSALQGSNSLATLLEHVATGGSTGMRRSAVSGGARGGRL